jgi:hypothetical protein
MTPIPPPAILSMMQAGYRADMVLRVAVNAVNGVRNRFGGGGRLRKADPEFYRLTERLRDVQNSGAMGLRVTRSPVPGSSGGTVMVLKGKIPQDVAEERGEIRRLLGLNQEADEFIVAYGSVAKDDREIAILSRSVLEILVDLASYVEVPPEHVEEKRAMPSFEDVGSDGKPLPPLLKIHSSSSVEKPADALVAVPYRGYWFWIDDRDVPSKALFSFLMFIFTLTETGGKDNTPIVTIPAG